MKPTIQQGKWTVNGRTYLEMTVTERIALSVHLNDVRVDMSVDFELPAVKDSPFLAKRISVIDINAPEFDLPLSQFNKYAV